MKEYIVPVNNTDRNDDEIFVGFVRKREELIRCKDCQHFEYDHVEHVDGVPLIMGHEICTRWGEGCKTSENGYCFMAERKER